jgi:hypothetical protein
MRTLTSAVVTELQKNQVQPFLAFEATFKSGIVRLWTGYGDLLLGGLGPFPTIAEQVLSHGTTLANGTYYCKLAKLDAGGSVALVSDESAAVSVVYNRKHFISLTSGDYQHGVRLYIGATAGAESQYRYQSQIDLAGEGGLYIEASDYVAGTVPVVGGTYKGIGTLGSVSPISETTDVAAVGMQFTLSGIPSDLMGYALAECRTGYPVKLWIGFLTTAGAIIADPALCFSGRMDTVAMTEGTDTATITISAENQLIDLQRPRLRRWTDDDQKRTYPTDDGFKWVPTVQEWNGSWGKLK